MGNILISEYSNTIQQSKIADLINEWALNDYDDGLNFNKQNSPKLWNKLLQKRACCTNQTNMILSFPYLIKDNNNNIIDVANSNSQTPYSPLTFETNSDCKFSIDNSSYESTYKIQVNDDGSWSWPNNNCSTLYNGTSQISSNIKGFCDHVKEDRQKNYTQPNQISYGSYKNDDNDNAYTDCNCKNSLLRKYAGDMKMDVYNEDTGKIAPHLSDDLIVQYLDGRCKNIQSYNKTYERSIKNLCIGSYNITNNAVSDGANINVGFQCNINTNNDSGSSNVQPTPINPTPVPTRQQPKPRPRPVPTTTAIYKPSFEPYNKKTLNTTIIVTSVVGTIALLIYMIVTIVLAVKNI
jgi:hypothetical protein